MAEPTLTEDETDEAEPSAEQIQAWGREGIFAGPDRTGPEQFPPSSFSGQ